MLLNRANQITQLKREKIMAYDPDARQTSNNAMIIGVVALVLVVLGALAYYATRSNETPTPVVVTQPTERIIEKTTEVAPTTTTPSTIVVQPGAPAAPAPTTRTETKVTVNTPPATNSAPARPATPSGSSNTTIVNNTPAASTKAPAGDSATSSPSTSSNTPGY